ncbi:MAG: arylsulfatase [Cyclobacteriaceae bacterium]|nr:arylsulfatase [Cyclobacteriaceae bacterium]
MIKVLMNSGVLYAISVSMILVLGSGCQTKREQNSNLQHPNVILILTDDQGWGDLGIHGNDKISTPSIDRMAGNGAQFERFYVSPLCAPTRASLLTGKYYLRTGASWVSKGLENMRSEEVTMAEIFQNNGYKTGAFGKWHNGAHYPEHPNRQGFEEFIGFCAGHWNNYFNTTLERNGEPFPTEGYITDVLTDEAIRFIENNRENKFFCYIPYNAPHGPFQVPDQYFEKYKSMGFNDKDATVYGMCENIDDNVRRLLEKVSELRLEENTIVIFMTDNGPNGERYNGGMRGIKGSIHEGGVRVPCFINWKGKIAPKSIETISAHIDMLPTLMTLCHLDGPENLVLDGVDLSAVLLGEDQALAERLYFTKKSTEFIGPDGAVRSDKYRLVIENGDTMLFDMKADPGQLIDISSNEMGQTNYMALAYGKWFEDVNTSFISDAHIKIGYEKEDKIVLPAHEASFSGDIHFKEGHGWAHDWLVNWKNISDSIYWDVQVDRASDYALDILYSCPEALIGSQLTAISGDSKANGVIALAHDPQYIQGNDRVVRMEVYEKEWARLPMGVLKLAAGKQQIILKVEHIKNGSVGEIKGIVLRKVIGE